MMYRYLLGLAIASLVFIIVQLVRNEMVYQARTKASTYTFEISQQDIERGYEWEHHWTKYRSYPSYRDMLYNFSCWTYPCWYKNLEKPKNMVNF